MACSEQRHAARRCTFRSHMWLWCLIMHAQLVASHPLTTVLPQLVLGGVRYADKQALISLFKLLGGQYWTNNHGWDPDGGADPCDVRNRWHGVGCIDPCDIYRDGPTCAFGRITALTLRDNNLTGSITNWTGVGDLHNLSWIDFSGNSISGSLPEEIGQVQNIEVLNLAFNELEGQLPTTLGALNTNGFAELNDLSLNHNRFAGSIPSELGLLTRLRMFNLAFNSLTGSIPVEITNLTEAQVLHVNGNQLDGTLPEDIGLMERLRYINGIEPAHHLRSGPSSLRTPRLRPRQRTAQQLAPPKNNSLNKLACGADSKN